MMMLSVLFFQTNFFFFLVIVFQFLELEQPTVGTDPYFPSMFYFSPQIIFFYDFKTISCHYSSLVLQLGCVQFLGTQLYFKDASLFLFFKRASGSQLQFPCSQFPGWQAIFSSVFQNTFSSGQ